MEEEKKTEKTSDASTTGTGDPLPTRDQLFQALMPVQDPEIHIGIVDLGLIYDVEVSESKDKPGQANVVVKMTLTTPACPYGEMLIAQAQKAVSDFPNVNDAKIDLVWEPPWDPREMASDFAKDQLGIW
ncbi:MAG: metal-sulfur cluster assembly factor [candidate division Zixibacteria bacterium]|nr:metal-sulfur cluster assembly factor [candidate division Zixibacteria bacterium]